MNARPSGRIRRGAIRLALASAGSLLAMVAAGPTRSIVADAARAEARPAGPAALAIDPGRSSLSFIIHRRGETIEGHAHEFRGEVAFDAAHPEVGSAVDLRVQAESLETGNRIRDHKMRQSHLEVERFPEIRFRSTSIRLSAGTPDAGAPDGGARPGTAGAAASPRTGAKRRALLEGILSLHGVERTLLFPATIRYDNGSLTAEGEATLRLTDHSIPIPRFLWIVLDDEVKVRFSFVASRAGSD
jgi:polyisoprenoid-binding protein YceI